MCAKWQPFCLDLSVLKKSHSLFIHVIVHFCREFLGPSLGGMAVDRFGFEWTVTVVAGMCAFMVSQFFSWNLIQVC